VSNSSLLSDLPSLFFSYLNDRYDFVPFAPDPSQQKFLIFGGVGLGVLLLLAPTIGPLISPR